MTERVLNTSVKQPLDVSPSTLLFGNAFSTDPSLPTQLDHVDSDVQPRSIRDYVDTLIERQQKIMEMDAAIQSQTSVNTSNLRIWYQTYSRAPKLRQRIETNKDDHAGTTEPVPIANIIAIKRTPKPPIFAVTKWFTHGMGNRKTLN